MATPSPLQPSDEAALKTLFNPQWYLAHYPDVAAAGIEPWQHFIRHGVHEQRFPCPLEVWSLDETLWQGDESALGRLHELVQIPGLEGSVAGWLLGRWYSTHGEIDKAEAPLQFFFNEPKARLLVRHAGPFLLLFSILHRQQRFDEAKVWLTDNRWPVTPDKSLAHAMLPGPERLLWLNQMFEQTNLHPVALLSEQAGPVLDNLAALPSSPAVRGSGWWPRSPLVSVIIPCHNAAATLVTALRSLQQQSWRNLQILVVDDASTDHSVQLVTDLAREDKRITLLRHSRNQGAYAARNTGLAAAKGRFITVHDADDWSHPQKIELQVRALMNNRHTIASVSHWVRCSPSLDFQAWGKENGWTYRNVSSLMFRRKVHKQLGYWDLVSVNADTEYYYRLIHFYGAKAITEVMPGVPLAFARVGSGSLTHQQATHLFSQYQSNGLRRRYNEAAWQWHQQTSGKQLYLEQSPLVRPFAVPHSMCRGNEQQHSHNLELLARQSGLFDAQWYLRRYPDVAQAGIDAWQHYLRHGFREGRDPGPRFSTSGYLYQYPESAGINPLLHLQTRDNATEYCLPQFGGKLGWLPGRPAILVCAHQVSSHSFGAERSLLDVLQAITAMGYNLVVSLPSADSKEYVEQVAGQCQQLVFLPYHWWHADRMAEPVTQDLFESLIEQFCIGLVYCNTLTLLEPLLAARSAGVPTVTHVRELPGHDAPLCAVLGADAQQIRQHLLDNSPCFIANSQVVADYLGCPERVSLVPNVIEASSFNVPLPNKPRLQVGMISSNLPKKGLHDFVKLAALLEPHHIDCLLIGPENEHTQALLAQPEQPGNLTVIGYVNSPQDGLALLDVVVNLSHFQESFGRTVLEAMAAARPVVCYRWGALPELVVDGQTGLMADYQDVDAVARHIIQLQQDNESRLRMGSAGQQVAARQFSPVSMQSALKLAFERILRTHDL
ncbi:glycosyltransferase [Zobellella denitrificans]